MQEGNIVLIISSLIILFIVVALIILFTVFQKKKTFLLEKQEEDKKRFEREIAETQIEIREETLRNISWELHDNIGQLLTLAKIQLQNATEENIAEVTKTISQGLTEVRSLSKLINPEAIKNIELKEAIQLEINRFNRLNFIASTLEIKGNEKEIDKKSTIIIFRILQEFFSNTIKHSRASELKVTLDYLQSNLLITAKDNGVGFSSEGKKDGIGLINIKNRAHLIGAEAVFKSEKNKGTTLEINYKL
ncbi:sensor histidine kinase [Polaribacter reichenbachii]|uniref:histidine kinase n=1 Tax=Polaribacter reichenbachii TaxID=996801 RepID=A0A1B8TVQ4_9FLAO|nr:ATP-binding protein [Polaribacter reichenbachii]APZ45264.1 sensor histidine kinase [Polaribacter reichenbachii]AUC19127.1 sensor histidine kinase [Polaribacter reichenbachii]OBY63717.1 histidine kinase [Polaribacter reichenbachii]